MKCLKHAYATVYFRETMTAKCPFCKLQAEYNRVLGKKNRSKIGPKPKSGSTVNLKLRLCVINLAHGVSNLWRAVCDGKYDSRGIVGDTTLSMQESLMEIGIDVRKKPLNLEALKGEYRCGQ